MLWFTCLIILCVLTLSFTDDFHAVSLWSNAKIFPWLNVYFFVLFFICAWTPNDWFQKPLRCIKIHFFLSVVHILATLIGLCLTSFISFFKSKSALELSNLSWWPRLALPCCIWPPPFFALFPNEFGQGAFFPSLTALFTFGLFDRLVRLHTKGEDHKLKIPFFQPAQPSSWFHDSLGGIKKMKWKKCLLTDNVTFWLKN